MFNKEPERDHCKMKSSHLVSGGYVSFREGCVITIWKKKKKGRFSRLAMFISSSQRIQKYIQVHLCFCDLYNQHIQSMVNCWFGLVVWDSRGTPK